MLAIGAFLVLLLTIGGTLLVRRLRLTRQELTETSAVLDETIEELRPAESDAKPVLTDQEKAIARLLVEGKSTKEIAEAVHLGVNTVLWYRKRLYAKFGVHNAAAFSTEMSKRGLLE
jgi:Response regulator containing a CheY-like receiver domain and an HTH DNA-binding domain